MLANLKLLNKTDFCSQPKSVNAYAFSSEKEKRLNSIGMPVTSGTCTEHKHKFSRKRRSLRENICWIPLTREVRVA